MNVYFTDSARSSRYEEPVAPEKVFFVGDICSDRSSYFRLIDTLRRNADPSPTRRPAYFAGDDDRTYFDRAYSRIMQENWEVVSPYAAQMNRIPHDDVASYSMWDVDVVVSWPVAQVFDYMQPTIGKVYRGSLGRFGISITLENGKRLCLRDGDFDTVRVVRPRFAW